MEQNPFNPETHRKDYEHTEAELSEVKESITGDKSNVELAELIAKRDALTVDLEAQKAKAYDQAGEDHKNITDASDQIEKLTAKIEQYKDQIAEITGVTEEKREERMNFPENLTATIARLKESGYLSTFEDKGFYRLDIKPLPKDEAIAEYRNRSDSTRVDSELEREMPYTIPQVETLGVMGLVFGKAISSDEALAEMDKLGVRPLTYEELIQYGIANPRHQGGGFTLCALGTKHILGDHLRVPFLSYGYGGYELGAADWDGEWRFRTVFLVVRK